MNGKEKTVLMEIYQAIGEVKSDIKNLHTDVTEVKKDLKDGNTKFDKQQEQITKNSLKIKFIYGIISFIAVSVGYTIVRSWNKLFGR